MEAVLQVENLSKTYPGNPAPSLKNAGFSLRKGEIVGVIGPSGAGKSTLLRCINRLIEPSRGNVCIEGEEITSARQREVRNIRRRVGMIFQHYNLVGRLTVMQNVMHGRLGYMSTLDGVLGRYSEEDKRHALELLGKTGLENFLYHRAGELSGGQKQRVGIVRALMQKPSILLCDEPIASLDPASAMVVMEMIRDLCREQNIACLVNLHQVDVAKKFCDRIIGMHAGEIVYDGPSWELQDSVIETIYGKPIEQLMLGGDKRSER